MLRAQSQRLSELIGHLEKMNVPEKTQDGKETQGSLLLKALRFIVSESKEMQMTNDKTMAELNALSEQHDVGSTPEQAVEKVIKYIQLSNPKFATMDSEAVKKALGFGNAEATH